MQIGFGVEEEAILRRHWIRVDGQIALERLGRARKDLRDFFFGNDLLLKERIELLSIKALPWNKKPIAHRDSLRLASLNQNPLLMPNLERTSDWIILHRLHALIFLVEYLQRRRFWQSGDEFRPPHLRNIQPHLEFWTLHRQFIRNAPLFPVKRQRTRRSLLF